MGISKPYKRTYRPVNSNRKNSSYSSYAYITDKEYCSSGYSYIRAYFLILEDLKRIFEFIEPSKESFKTYSYRIHELFMRTCIEIEANFKAILLENDYSLPKKRKFLTIKDYKKINISHHLSEYIVGLPQWESTDLVKFQPFKEWKIKNTLTWYSAYNSSKHDRNTNFRKSSFENLLNSVAALLCLLHSQFQREDFSPAPIGIIAGDGNLYEMKASLGYLFRIQEPNNWTVEELYDFDWQDLKNEKIRFQKYDYNAI